MDYLAARGLRRLPARRARLRAPGAGRRRWPRRRDATRRSCARRRGQGHRRGGRLHPQALAHPARQPDRWSWGTTLIGDLHDAERHQKSSGSCSTRPAGSARPPRWCRPGRARSAPIGPPARTGADRWMTGVPEDKKATLIPAGLVDAWANATWATDPDGAKQNPRVLARPTASWRTARITGRPTSPITIRPGSRCRPCWCGPNGTAICRPTCADAVPLLVNSPGKRYVMLAEAPTPIIMEKNRRAVQGRAGVLDEQGRS